MKIQEISMSFHCKHASVDYACMQINKKQNVSLKFTKIWCISRFICSLNPFFFFCILFTSILQSVTLYNPLQHSRKQPAVSLINTQEHPAILFINTVCVKRLDVKLKDRLLNIHPLFFFLCITFLILLVCELANSIPLTPSFQLPDGLLVCYLEFRGNCCRMEGDEASSSLLIHVWIRNLWMKAQHSQIKTLCEWHISTREGGNMFETLCSLTLPSNEYFIQPRVRNKESERDERLLEESQLSSTVI